MTAFVSAPAEAARLGARTRALLDDLATITDEPGRITRLYLSPAHGRARDRVADWMRAAGLDVAIDALGSVRGRRAAGGPASGAAGNRRLLVGSHIDSVIDAGRYDGCLGVVAGIVVAEELAARGVALPFGLEIVAFGDEEGVRFPSNLSSSAALAGGFRPEWLAGRDADGVSFAEALRAFGGDPDGIAGCAVDPEAVIGYLELHIEQGPVLEHGGAPLGVVTSIAGASRLRIVVDGEAGHAGTVPMALRRDAFAAVAELAVAVESVARADDGANALVATIGRVEVAPGAINVVPGRVVATLDLRAASDAPRDAALIRIRDAAAAIAGRRGVSIVFEPMSETPTVPMDAALQDLVAAGAGRLGLAAPRLSSGAGHDAQAMARRFPAAMLFVRSVGGISHNPAEFTEEADLGLAVAALLNAVLLIAEREAAR
jgi:allantoate deiminase